MKNKNTNISHLIQEKFKELNAIDNITLQDLNEYKKYNIQYHHNFLNESYSDKVEKIQNDINIENTCVIIEKYNNNNSIENSMWNIRENCKVVHLYISLSNKLQKRTINCNENSQYQCIYLHCGDICDVQWDVNLNHNNASVIINSAQISNADDINNIDIHINHNSSKTHSNIKHLNISRNKSSMDFSANILIPRDSGECTSHTKIQTIFTDENSTARSMSKPILRIYNKNIECSHGASSSGIDKEILFYLSSRGMSKEIASNIIIKSAILNALDNSINNEIFKDIIKENIIL